MAAPKSSASASEAATDEAVTDEAVTDEDQAGGDAAGQGEAGQDEAGQDDSGQGDSGQKSAGAPGGGPRWRQVGTLLVVAAVLAGFGVFAAIRASDLRASRADSNLALSDKTLTRQVTGQIAAAVSTIFSYTYANPGTTRQAAQHVLTGSAIGQYNKLFTLVEQKAPTEKLVLHTKVTDIGVELLTTGRARLLVFVNQQDQAGSGQAVYSGAMFAVTAVRHGSHWLISNINTFTSSG